MDMTKSAGKVKKVTLFLC